MELRVNYKFKIHDMVYINAPGGEELIVVNLIYNFLHQSFEYQVMNSEGNKEWYNEHEITSEKPNIKI